MGACSRTMSSTNRAPTKPFVLDWLRAGAGASGGRAAPGVVRLLPPPTSDESADAGTPLLGPLAVAVGAATADDVGADRARSTWGIGRRTRPSSESCDARARDVARMPAGRFVADAEPGRLARSTSRRRRPAVSSPAPSRAARALRRVADADGDGAARAPSAAPSSARHFAVCVSLSVAPSSAGSRSAAGRLRSVGGGLGTSAFQTPRFGLHRAPAGAVDRAGSRGAGGGSAGAVVSAGVAVAGVVMRVARTCAAVSARRQRRRRRGHGRGCHVSLHRHGVPGPRTQPRVRRRPAAAGARPGRRERAAPVDP